MSRENPLDLDPGTPEDVEVDRVTCDPDADEPVGEHVTCDLGVGDIVDRAMAAARRGGRSAPSAQHRRRRLRHLPPGTPQTETPQHLKNSRQAGLGPRRRAVQHRPLR